MSCSGKCTYRWKITYFCDGDDWQKYSQAELDADSNLTQGDVRWTFVKAFCKDSLHDQFACQDDYYTVTWDNDLDGTTETYNQAIDFYYDAAKDPDGSELCTGSKTVSEFVYSARPVVSPLPSLTTCINL